MLIALPINRRELSNLSLPLNFVLMPEVLGAVKTKVFNPGLVYSGSNGGVRFSSLTMTSCSPLFFVATKVPDNPSSTFVAVVLSSMFSAHESYYILRLCFKNFITLLAKICFVQLSSIQKVCASHVLLLSILLIFF